ncbi:hypothetical protein E2F46_01890 [Luteimonas aestuarii]|uniref:Uncharacterized protein n=1 Tax=Luteimonas aestuarii TaxID=453837 RepID=A0A4R5U4W5_9GAMM|nr:hypothetical protein [Luteimonas aestuarii]TDK28643.1 hypothetical protein E2F46_01890 [Luteimonas aestuarii]
MTWIGGPAAKAGVSGMELIIAKAPDADPATLTEAELERGVARWTLSLAGEQNPITLKRFRPRDYSGINVVGDIECVEGGSVFFCHVAPSAMIDFGNDEKMVSRTGFWGSALHQGGFELTRLDPTP